ncbi:MAG: hypothetical protein ABWZ85_02550 [Luteibacter sp.]
MAAPETPRLKAMRLAILATCIGLIVWIGSIGALRVLIGNAAAALAGSLLMLLVVLVPLYVRAKTLADDAHLDSLIAAGVLGGEGEGE